MEIKNKLDELTVDEFTEISSIMKDADKLSIEKYFDIMVYLGADEDKITDEELIEFAKTINRSESNFSEDLKKYIEVDGRKYISYEDKFEISAKDLVLIEKSLNKKDYYARVLAILFKREDLTKKEHYEEAHIKWKTELFKSLNAMDYYSYILYITKKIGKNLYESTEILASDKL